MIDFLMDYEDAAFIVKKLGWDGWIEHMNRVFPKHHFFSTTTDWLKWPHEFNAKLKGGDGDLIVGWKK